MNELDSLKPRRKARPSNSVAYGAGVGAPIAVLIPFIAGQFGVSIGAEVAGAIGALVTSVISYFPRGGRSD